MDQHIQYDEHSVQKTPKKLLDQVRDAIRVKHYALSTEKTYISWIRRYILFHGKRHPGEMGACEIEAFLTYLAVDQKVAASTQNQAFNALLFLYHKVLRKELDHSIEAVRAKRPKRIPTVLTREEARAIINTMSGTPKLIVQILYGGGWRLMECLRLRVKDIDFARRQLVIREAKGMKDRVTVLPDGAQFPLQAHLERVQMLHRADLKKGYGCVYLPFALERKYPNGNGAGSMFFLHRVCPGIQEPV